MKLCDVFSIPGGVCDKPCCPKCKQFCPRHCFCRVDRMIAEAETKGIPKCYSK